MVYKRQLFFQYSRPSGCDTSKLLSDDLKNKLYYDGFQKNAVSLLAPNHENPNLFSIGEGFGFFVFFGNDNSGSFPTAVCPKPYQKKDHITKVTTVKVP